MKQFYVMELNAGDIPLQVITGPFETYDQAVLAADACKPIFNKTHRLVPVGGDLYTPWLQPKSHC